MKLSTSLGPGASNEIADSLSRIVVKTDIKTERSDAEAYMLN